MKLFNKFFVNIIEYCANRLYLSARDDQFLGFIDIKSSVFKLIPPFWSQYKEVVFLF